MTDPKTEPQNLLIELQEKTAELLNAAAIYSRSQLRMGGENAADDYIGLIWSTDAPFQTGLVWMGSRQAPRIRPRSNKKGILQSWLRISSEPWNAAPGTAIGLVLYGTLPKAGQHTR